ncbi:hypothetical protein Runsl_1130 [Runella slithyformis DSM 19594]|uniref:Uncharacterized protein n=1 Tax=Runella slithyformis (strain ATCC 29530 / DSM 19594 / LMG 11500 / NCIMB 11436 / LSU 4) TaxID=761193 RepID=A0A7U4E4R4_RUNSL|nr:hypothetical protein Runsl_1130 [Runella slithyformis DSM 19594]
MSRKVSFMDFLLLRQVFRQFLNIFFAVKVFREVKSGHVEKVIQRRNRFHHSRNKVGRGRAVGASAGIVPNRYLVNFYVFYGIMNYKLKEMSCVSIRGAVK